MSRRLGLCSALLLLVLLPLAACTIALKDRPLDGLQAASAGALQTAPSAVGIPGRVGWARITLFAIPVVPIFVVDGSTPSSTNTRAEIANREVMKQVRRALAHAGYEVTDAPAVAAGRTLECNVERFKFNNYTWIVPIVPAWGSARLTLTVRDSAGAALWTQSFEGDGFSLNPFDGFSGAANQSMREILNAMVPAFQSPEFRSAATGS
jgi:outer membrane lipopolysaccharide assembly protein LptE/RlpB